MEIRIFTWRECGKECKMACGNVSENLMMASKLAISLRVLTIYGEYRFNLVEMLLPYFFLNACLKSRDVGNLWFQTWEKS